MKPGKAIYNHKYPVIKDGDIVLVSDQFEVRIMAIAEGYAMVRRKGCMPFVSKVKDLKQEGK